MNLVTPGTVGTRGLKQVALEADLVIIGGGLAGTCCAITAARQKLRVVLIQDRPVLGGNASSEVRLWILGATSHMGNNNRWAREGGVIDEILVENLYRNPEGNALILDSLLLEKVVNEPNITLLLNTAVHDLEKADPETIRSVRAFCSQNSTSYDISAPLFCDASGDGIVGFMAGAAFRMGAEASSEFNEKFAPPQATRELLGHTMYFYSRDTGRPVNFVPPSFALADITRVPRWRDFKVSDYGCRLWWLEWGGLLDTIHDCETIKWELWKVVYGVWNHIKNSGQFPEAKNLTLEWVSTIPGKRESRRFEGDYILNQRDIVEQRRQPDAVSFGGWAIDLHPPEGVFSEKPGCTQWHSKGIYQIPFRCLYSRNIRNLFLAGRIISASHVAFGSTRVMATCAHNAQAVAVAASLCHRYGLAPGELSKQGRIPELQQQLLATGQFIPGVRAHVPENLALQARVEASSQMRLWALEPDGTRLRLDQSWAMMVPLTPGTVPRMRIALDVDTATELKAELRISSKPENHTPDVTLEYLVRSLPAGENQSLDLQFDAVISEPCYAFFCLMKNPAVSVVLSSQRLTGVLAVTHNGNKAVAKSATQSPPKGIGIESFEFWTPQRRPGGKNLACSFEPPLEQPFRAESIVNGSARPTHQPNAWVADWKDEQPEIRLEWSEPKQLTRVELVFDTDYDHPAESVLMGHPERVMPFCVPGFEIRDATGVVLYRCQENHLSRRCIAFERPVITNRLIISLRRPVSGAPAALFEVRCY